VPLETVTGKNAVLFMSPVKMQIVGTIAKEVFSMQDLPPGRGKCPADVQF
jgi:hypothetical protein